MIRDVPAKWVCRSGPLPIPARAAKAAAAITGMAARDEAITVALMKVALRMRTARLAYALPRGYLEMG